MQENNQEPKKLQDSIPVDTAQSTKEDVSEGGFDQNPFDVSRVPAMQPARIAQGRKQYLYAWIAYITSSILLGLATFFLLDIKTMTLLRATEEQRAGLEALGAEYWQMSAIAGAVTTPIIMIISYFITNLVLYLLTRWMMGLHEHYEFETKEDKKVLRRFTGVIVLLSSILSVLMSLILLIVLRENYISVTTPVSLFIALVTAGLLFTQLKDQWLTKKTHLFVAGISLFVSLFFTFAPMLFQ